MFARQNQTQEFKQTSKFLSNSLRTHYSGKGGKRDCDNSSKCLSDRNKHDSISQSFEALAKFRRRFAGKVSCTIAQYWIKCKLKDVHKFYK